MDLTGYSGLLKINYFPMQPGKQKYLKSLHIQISISLNYIKIMPNNILTSGFSVWRLINNHLLADSRLRILSPVQPTNLPGNPLALQRTHLHHPFNLPFRNCVDDGKRWLKILCPQEQERLDK